MNEIKNNVFIYSKTSDENKTKKKTLCIKVFKKIGKFIFIIFTIVFQFTMAERCINCLKYALKSRNCKKKDDKVGQRKYFIKMLKEEQDIALLRVLECFIEAAPQQILQLSLFIHDYHGEFNILCKYCSEMIQFYDKRHDF